MDLNLLSINPASLAPNPWNTNRVSAENQRKLDESLKRLDSFKPILVRELPNGTLQILGGENRRNSAIRLGLAKVPVISVGVIDDIKAKEISLADNERYGEDDADALKHLLDSLDTAAELSSFLPMSLDEFDSFASLSTIDLDDLDIDDDDQAPIERPEPSAPTHRVMRFKLAVEDAEKLSTLIEKTIKQQGLTSSDALTNAGDALVHICKEVW